MELVGTTLNHANGTGTNRVIFIAIGFETNGANSDPTSVTYGTAGNVQKITSIQEPVGGTGYNNYNWIGYCNEACISAAGASITITPVYSATPANDTIIAVTLTGVDQSAPVNINQAGLAGEPITTSVNNASGGMALYQVTFNGVGANSVTEATNFIEGLEVDTGGSGFRAETGSSATSGSLTVNPISSVASNRTTLTAVSFNQAAAGSTVSVTNGTNPANATVYANDTNRSIDGFTMTASAGTPAVTGVTATVTNPADLSSIRLYRDIGSTVGTYDAGDALLATVASPTGTVNFTSLTEAPATTGTNYIIVGDVAASATPTDTVTAVVTALTVTGPDTQGTVSDTSATLTIGSAPCVRNNPTVAISPSAQNVAQGSSANYTLTVTNNDTGSCGATTFNLTWTNTPAMPNSNFSTTGQVATIGPINPGASSPTLIFTHVASGSAPLSTTQQSRATTAADANHGAVIGNTVTSTVVVAVPAGSWSMFLIVFLGIVGYGIFYNRKQKRATS